MGEDIHIRPATASDLPDVHRLVESAYRGDSARAGWTHEADLLEGPRTSIETLRAIVDDPKELLLLVTEAASVIGCVQLTDCGNQTAYLGLLAVDPARQGDGLGKRIMKAAEAEASRRFGAGAMELSVVSQRVELIAYYERRGYARTGEERPFPIPLDPPFTLVMLRKMIGPERA